MPSEEDLKRSIKPLTKGQRLILESIPKMKSLGSIISQDQCEIKQCEDASQAIETTLKRKKQRLESQLQDVNNALEILEKNPELTKCLELLAKANRF